MRGIPLDYPERPGVQSKVDLVITSRSEGVLPGPPVRGTSPLRPRRPALTKAFGVNGTLCVLVALFLCFSMPASAQRREVWGVVTDNSGQAVPGAAVKLTNRVTLKIRSYVTQADGKYRFGGLHPDMDYTVRALKDGQRSNTHRLSHFGSDKSVRADLRIDTGK